MKLRNLEVFRETGYRSMKDLFQAYAHDKDDLLNLNIVVDGGRTKKLYVAVSEMDERDLIKEAHIWIPVDCSIDYVVDLF